MSDQATLAAGTIVRFSTNLSTPSYTVIPGVSSVGAVGLQSEAKEKTVLADTNKKYGAGIQDAPDKSVKGQYFGSDADQKSFLDACKAKTPMLIQVEYPDVPNGGTTGTVAEFEFQPLGFELDDVTAEDWMMFTVNGKQNSQTWTDPT